MKNYFGFDFIGVESSGGTIYYKVKGNWENLLFR